MSASGARSSAVTAALVVLAVSGVLTTLSAVRAVMIRPAVDEAIALSETTWKPAWPDTSEREVDLAAIVGRDVFRAGRTAPARRYTLPSARVRPAAARSTMWDNVTLVGTTVFQSGGGTAVIRRQDGRVITLEVGESLDGFTLRTVERGRAVLVSPSGVVVTLQARRAGG